MTSRRKPLTRWAMPKVFFPRSARNIIGALVLSITAAASHVHSARVTIALTPSGIAATVTIETSWWHSLRASSIHTASGQPDGMRACPGTVGRCWVDCGDAVIGPFGVLGVTVTFYSRSARSGGAGLSCIDIQFGPMLDIYAGGNTVRR
jgi:hypothetical protein